MRQKPKRRSPSVIGSAAVGCTNALVLEGDGKADNVFLDFETLSVQAKGTRVLRGGSRFSERRHSM